MFTPEMLARDAELRARQDAEDNVNLARLDKALRAAGFPVSPKTLDEEKLGGEEGDKENQDSAATVETTTESDTYGELDASPKQAGEVIAKISVGKMGEVEAYYDPLTRICRPIPEGA